MLVMVLLLQTLQANISRVDRYTYFLSQLETLKSALSRFEIWAYNSGPRRWAGTTKFGISSN